jgi:thioredoxin-related protein
MNLRSLIALLVLTLAHPALAADTTVVPFFQLSTGDLKAELAEAKQAGKKGLLVMFEQEGCPACLFMKTNILNRPDVQRYYGERFVSLSVDMFGAVPYIDLAGKAHTEKTYAQALGIKATPTFVFYGLDGKEATRVVGSVKSPAEFMLLGDYVASGAYRTRKFSEYKQAHSPKGT